MHDLPATPAVSVVMPVYNGARFLARAIASLSAQTFPGWELLAVDDGSADDSAARLETAARADPRVRVFRHPANRGISAARNTALAAAAGDLVAYLDCDDEFYPDHLARAWDHRARGDVLVFRYDLVEDRPGHPHHGGVTTYDPEANLGALVTDTLAVPLGVVHHRVLLARVGGFDEALGRHRGWTEDADMWRRFVRAGAVFAFVPRPSGRYYVRADSLSRTQPPRPARPDDPAPALAPVTVRIVPSASPPGGPPRAVELRPPVRPDSPTNTRPAAPVPRVITAEIRTPAGRVALWLPAADAWLVNELFERHEYGGVAPEWLRDPPTVLDVGANAGVFAVYARLAFHPRAVVHCFEPCPATLDLLRANVAPFPGVTVHPVALGRADGEASLLLHPQHPVAHSLRPDLVPAPAGRVRVRVRDAGTVWDELGLGEVDVLKLDAEGAEPDVLEALGPRVGRVRVVLAEYHTPEDRRRIDELLPGHVRFAAAEYTPRIGVVKYVRADLADVPPREPTA